MANSRSDSVLVIRAKDEAQSTIKAVTKALDDLLTNFRDGGSQTAQFAKGMAAIDSAMGKLSSQADSAESAFKRVNDAIGAKRGDLQGVTQQLVAATQALANFNAQSRASAGKSDSFVGPLNFGPQIKAASAAISDLEKQQGRLTADIAKMEAGIQGGASSLQVMGSAATGMEAKIAAARAEIDRTTKSMAAQEAQARAAGAVLGRVNSVTGVGAAPATQNGAGFEALAEREIALQKQREAAANSAAKAVRDSVNTTTGVSRPAATDSGATFSALASRADAQVLKEAADAHAVFEARVKSGAAAMRDEEAALKKLRDQLDPIAALERATAAEIQKLVQWEKQGKISAEELANATKLLNAQLTESKTRLNGANGLDSRGRPSLFGLKPYELQNLSFQINDIFTQLGSGASITQTLAQQGGQILQIFPRAGASIVAAFTNPAVLAFGVTIGAIVLGFKRLNDEADRLRSIQGTLSSIGNGGDYNAGAINTAAKAYEQYGISAEQAVKIVRTFVNEGIPQGRFEQFGRTAKDLADVLGIDVVDAAKQLAAGFDGTYEGIKRLDDSTNLLTSSERERIKSLFDQGKAQDALRLAYDTMSARLEKGAQDMRGPWAEATRSLSTAWSGFLDYLSKTSIVTGMAESLTELANGITRVLNSISGVKSIRDIDVQIEQLQKRIGSLNETRSIGGVVGGFFRDLQIDEAVAKIKELQKERAKLVEEQQKANPSAGGGTSGSGGSSANDFRESPQVKKESDETLKNMSLEEQLQDLREKGQKAVNNLRVRNEGFLTDAEKRRREALAGELAATKAVGDQRVKDAAREKAIRDEQDKIQQEQDSFTTASNTPQMLARQFLIGREGFKSRAYWDVNHYRVGYGSDTVTRADGSVSSVTANTTASVEDAVRDLDRRIGEFQNAIKATIGSDRFNSFSPEQQAAVTSVAYNYGKLPERIVDALRHGTADEIQTAIRGLGNDNAGVNRARRNMEANTFSTSNVALTQNTANQQKELADSESKFGAQVDGNNAKLKQRTDELNKQAGLQGEALLNAQAQAAADAAELALRERVTQENETRKAQNKELLYQGEEGKKQLLHTQDHSLKHHCKP